MGKIHIDSPTRYGRHPNYEHLVMFKVEQYCDILILTSKAKKNASARISREEWIHMVGEIDQADLGFAYCVDEYLDILKYPDEWRG
jgi:hypothetical protein